MTTENDNNGIDNNKAEEPSAAYANRIRVTTLEALENETIFATLNFTHEQRMGYLQKLRNITYNIDLKEARILFINSKITINSLHENS
jgi:hypothetical protein